MAEYITPEKVTAPSDHVEVTKIIFDGGLEDWSVASGKWGDKDKKKTPCFLVRWNGSKDKPWGYPSRAKTPLWMVAPEWLENDLMAAIGKRNVKLLEIEKNK